jgi:glucokinase
VLAAVIAPDGSVASRAKKKVAGRGRDVAGVIDRIADVVREAASDAGIDAGQLGAVGIGAPGPVVLETGVVTEAVNLGWRDVPLKAELERRLGVPIAVGNDVRVAVLAEHLAGAGRGVRSLVGIWPGTGIGGGVIVNDEIVTGANNSAGEIGHMTIKAGGPVCACGGRGHLEALASRTAIVREIVKQLNKGQKTALTTLVVGDVTRATSSDLAEALRQGDKVVIAALDRAAKYLSIGIASVANVLNPELVILGGGLVQALGEPFVRKVALKVDGRPMLAATQPLRIVQSALGDDAGIVGAGILARRLAASSADKVSTASPVPAVAVGIATGDGVESRV